MPFGSHPSGNPFSEKPSGDPTSFAGFLYKHVSLDPADDVANRILFGPRDCFQCWDHGTMSVKGPGFESWDRFWGSWKSNCDWFGLGLGSVWDGLGVGLDRFRVGLGSVRFGIMESCGGAVRDVE